ncbi:hypothetical protein BOTCAL_0296g00030 [Botryotinia calthae]|uniref:Uncharacterized protein n=1 Tax=Botryotinia calthae TaxID=38488 RepID=A0A4Y8CUN1_9HELO|nr:hypothetical protein BOTCAL_0296g00030 [Botryotinia calthae]
MDQKPVRPLEAIINKASKHYMIKISQSSSQTAGAPGPSQGPSMASSVHHPRTGIDSSQGGSVLRIDIMPVPGQGFSGNRAFIKSLWDSTEANGQIPGARTFTFVLDPATPPFVPSQGSLYGRLEEEGVTEDDCGFLHCGGLCALYAPCAANGDNNGALQQASFSAVQNEGEANIVPNEDNVQIGDIVPGGGNASDTEDDSDDDEEGGASLDWEDIPLAAEQRLELDEEIRTEIAEIKRGWILSGRFLNPAYPHKMGCACFFCILDG